MIPRQASEGRLPERERLGRGAGGGGRGGGGRTGELSVWKEGLTLGQEPVGKAPEHFGSHRKAETQDAVSFFPPPLCISALLPLSRWERIHLLLLN